MDEDNLRDQNGAQPLSPAEEAKLIEEEQRGLKWCLRHELVVWWDGPGDGCPACAFQRQQREEAAKVFLEMTQDLSTENHNEKT